MGEDVQVQDIEVDPPKIDADSIDISESMTEVEEQLRAISPEFISKKLDEALSDPENLRRMQEQGINVDDIASQKPELVQRLYDGMQTLLKSLPELQGDIEDQARVQIEQAVQDFPKMFDDALQSEIAESMARADQRMQKKFEDAARETDEARNFLENGELPSDPNNELVQKYDEGVVNYTDTLLQMWKNDPNSVESMKPMLQEQGDFGQQVVELLEQRIAAEEAALEGAAPATTGAKP